jgi:hypothetical protein
LRSSAPTVKRKTVRKNTLELIIPSAHHNSCFWQFLLVSFCFPQISSSYPDLLARGRVWTAYHWAQRTLHSEKCQYKHLFLDIHTVTHFTWPIGVQTVVLFVRHPSSWVYGPYYDGGLGQSAWGTPQTGAAPWSRIWWR